MNILSSIFTDDLAIDLGTVNTLIFAPERGVVLDEPSAVAIHKYTGEVLEVGAEAFKMLGREPKDGELGPLARRSYETGLKGMIARIIVRPVAPLPVRSLRTQSRIEAGRTRP